MKTKQKNPIWFVIIGQSGSGKGAAAGIIEKCLQKNKMPIYKIGTGDVVREIIKTDTYMARKMGAINNQGFKQPAIIASSFWLGKFFKEYKGETVIHEGSPRSVEEFKNMLAVSNMGYLPKIMVIEISATEKNCYDRLYKRTVEGKRADLSFDEKLGIPNPQKIKNKMTWWNKEYKSIVRACKNKAPYLVVKNDQTIKQFEIRLNAMMKKIM